MWQADPVRLAEDLSKHFGLHLHGERSRAAAGEFLIELAPVGVHPNESFRIRLELGWRSFKAVFMPGPFAGLLISEMGHATPVGGVVFRRLAEKCLAENARLTMNINGAQTSTADPVSWPDAWQSLDLVLDKTPLAINTDAFDNLIWPLSMV